MQGKGKPKGQASVVIISNKGNGSQKNGKPIGMTSKQQNDQLLQKMKAEKAAFDHLFPKVFEELKVQDYAYLISTKFLNEWKQYIDYDDKASIEEHNKAYLRKKPEKMNADLLAELGEHVRFPDPEAPCSTPIKPDIKMGRDYFLADQELWNLFKKSYEGIQIKRQIELTEDGKSYNIKDDFYTVVTTFIYRSFLQKLENGEVKQLKQKFLQVPNDITIKRMKAMIAKVFNKLNVFRFNIDGNSVRLWTRDPKYGKLIELSEYIKDSCTKSRSYDYQIVFNGQLLDRKPHEFLKDFVEDSSEDNLLVVEVNEPGKLWTFFNDNVKPSKKCDLCKTINFLDYNCICGKKFYCSEFCKYSDKLEHSKKCGKAFDSDEEKEVDKKYKCIDGLCGLENLGNTCYMNSAIQCLSSVGSLSRHFYENKYKPEINVDNPLGTKGKITKKFAYLIKKLWLDDEKAFAPYSFKYAMAKYQTIFEGSQQHDPNEFLFFLLDALHEDLNLILKKPYTEAVEDVGRTDKQMATEYWNTFLLRNKSIIVDQMFGLFKSTIQCQRCAHISRNFETYSICSVPIPDQQPEVEVFVVFNDYKQKPYRMMMKYPDDRYTLAQLEQNLIYMLGLKGQAYAFAMSSPEVFEPLFNKSKTVDQVCKELNESYLLLFELNEDEVNLMNSTDEWIAMGIKMVKRERKGPPSKLGPIRMKIIPRTINGFEVYTEILIKARFQFEENWPYKQDISQLSHVACFDAIYDAIGEPFMLFGENPKSSFKIEYGDKQPFLNKYNKSKQIVSVSWDVNPDYCKVEWFRGFIRFDPYKQGENKEQLIKEKQIMSVQDCLKSFSLAEELGEDNFWFCSKCQKHQPAIKNLEIFNTPKLLILHLKRFKGAGNNRWNRTESKITDIIKFPLTDFDITDYVISKDVPTTFGEVYEKGQGPKSMDSQNGGNNNNSNNNHLEESKSEQNQNKSLKEVPKDRVLYDLVGVIHHIGVMNSGHCISHCKHPKTNEWYEFNDEKVTKVTNLEKLVTDTAYILFYSRKN